MKKLDPVWVRSLAAAMLILAVSPSLLGAAPSRDECYPYGGVEFTRFVSESYHTNNVGSGNQFYRWFESNYKESINSYPGKQSLDLRQLLLWKHTELEQVKDLTRKTRDEIALAAWVHKMVKSVIPRFSLDRGFEFCNVVSCGERQCFLQSVLIAALLQATGVDAGVVMVYKNTKGEPSNNGHAVTLIKLANCTDIVVDASDQDPFPKHMGLFLRSTGYKYVKPNYICGSARIAFYQLASGGARIIPTKARMLSVVFLRSQFFYYRGERALGGIVSLKHTRYGMQASVRYLRESARICPENPLAVYMLARVLHDTGDAASARLFALNAATIYKQDGWTPSGMTDLLKTVGAL